MIFYSTIFRFLKCSWNNLNSFQTSFGILWALVRGRKSYMWMSFQPQSSVSLKSWFLPVLPDNIYFIWPYIFIILVKSWILNLSQCTQMRKIFLWTIFKKIILAFLAIIRHGVLFFEVWGKESSFRLINVGLFEA